MKNLAIIFTIIVMLEHYYIMTLEMFFFESKLALKTFGINKKLASDAKTLGANQGLYNGFLATGILFGLLYQEPVAQKAILIYFLMCVVVAASYGAISVKKSILLKQGTPAMIAVLLVIFFL